MYFFEDCSVHDTNTTHICLASVTTCWMVLNFILHCNLVQHILFFSKMCQIVNSWAQSDSVMFLFLFCHFLLWACFHPQRGIWKIIKQDLNTPNLFMLIKKKKKDCIRFFFSYALTWFVQPPIPHSDISFWKFTHVLLSVFSSELSENR